MAGYSDPADTILSATGPLRQHKLRSGLAALGIIIGTSATIATLAVEVTSQVRSLGSNLLVVVSGNVNESGVRAGAGALPTLSDEDATAIGQEVASVQVTSSVVSGKIQVVADAANWST